MCMFMHVCVLNFACGYVCLFMQVYMGVCSRDVTVRISTIFVLHCRCYLTTIYGNF